MNSILLLQFNCKNEIELANCLNTSVNSTTVL